MILYRPVSLQELELIYDGGMKAFPARLPQQPIFYPVLQLEYARKTASGWNARNGQLAGYVTQFKVEDSYIGQFEFHTVTGSQYQELWIPAEEIEDFNKHITGHIKVLEGHFGDEFQGFTPEKFGLQGKNAVEQFTLLANSYIYKRMDFYLELKRNHKAIFLNYPFWQRYDFKNPGLKEKVLQAIKEAWLTSFPKIPLPLPVPENPAPVEDLTSPALVEPAQEDTTPEEEVNLPLPVRTSYHDPLRDRQNYASSLIQTIEEDETPEEQGESEDDVDLLEKDDTRTEETSSNSLAEDAPEETPVLKEPVTPFWVRPVRQEIAPPKQRASHVVQGIQLGLEGKYREAIQELSQAIAENPRDVISRTSLGVAFHRLGEDDRALSCYAAALQVDPKHAEAHYFRANIFYSQGNVREAIEGYTKAIGLKPALLRAHEGPIPQDRLTDYTSSPSEVHSVARPAHRILDLDNALESNPGQANLFKERAAHYYRLENYEQAIADYTSSLALHAEDATAFHSRGLAYEKIGQHERARKDYEQATAIDPQLSNLYIQRGVTFGSMGNLRQAIDSLSDGIRLAPGNPDAYFNRGTAYYQQGDLERAIQDFSNVIRLAPKDEAAYYWRGTSNEEAGRQGEAIADYRQFLTLSQDPRARQDVEHKLRQWSTLTADRPKMNRIDSKQPERAPDLYDLIDALGRRARNSTWLGSGVECYGESAEELSQSTTQEQPIEGGSLLRMASGIHKTVRGDFLAFDPDSTSHWVFIRAWEGTGFYVETNDPSSTRRLRARFPSLEDVEGASAPYESLFLPNESSLTSTSV